MLKAKVSRIMGVVLCLMIAGAALGTIYTWTGDDDNCTGEPFICYWSAQLNWNPSTGSPSTPDDDAVVDTAEVTITLRESVTIDDLYVSEWDDDPTVFTTDGTAYTVTCDTITVSGTKVKLMNEAGFEAIGTEPCPAPQK